MNAGKGQVMITGDTYIHRAGRRRDTQHWDMARGHQAGQRSADHYSALGD